MRCAVSCRWITVLAFSVVITLIGPSAAVGGDGWQWSITPYMWASDISEDLLVDGAVVGGDDTDFKDLVDKIDSSLQLHLEGVGDRWGLFANVSYVEVKDSEIGEAGLTRLDVEIEDTVWEAGLIFRPGGRSGTVDLLLGARNLAVDETYRLQLVGIAGRELQIDESYLDALIGARWHILLSPRWVISLRGDASFGDTDTMWTAQGMLGWRFGSRRQSAVLVGYRYRELEYTKADVVDVAKTLSGPGVALRIGF